MWSWGTDGECVLWRPSSKHEFAAASDPVIIRHASCVRDAS
jgi:hypothetical protein